MKTIAIALMILSLLSCEEALVTPQNQTSDEITVFESYSLQFMREEEKLARDIYLALYDKWSMQTFINIAGSEQKHTDAVKGLLDDFEIEDPVKEDVRGVYVNKDLQNLYEDLLATGSESIVEALQVGALIEEVDLVDLEDQAASITNNDILQVYAQLAKGSRNHLRAYVKALEAQGITYEPSHLDIDTYNSIINSGTESGRG